MFSRYRKRNVSLVDYNRCGGKPSITTGTEDWINGHVREDKLRPHNKILTMDMLEDRKDNTGRGADSGVVLVVK